MLNWYTGSGKKPSRAVDVSLRHPLAETGFVDLMDPSSYILAGAQKERVTAAVNTALALKLPLLVGGEPGSGKTQLGYAVAYELGRPAPHLFVTGSGSVATDLFYRYDAIRHFRAAQAGGKSADADPRPFISYAALGLAILLAMKPTDRQSFVGDNAPDGLSVAPPSQSVVVVDEIDKAPRDFPNDLLSQLSTMRFEVPELGGKRTPELDPKFFPIIILTTNSERQLPDAFLRRCAYVHVEPPAGDDLVAILRRKFSAAIGEQQVLLQDVVAFHDELRSRKILDKPPSTAEILQFFQALIARNADPAATLSKQRRLAEDGISLLAKHRADLDKVRVALSERA